MSSQGDLGKKRRDREEAGKTSPVGWYVGTYLLRFVELDRGDRHDPEARFMAWENTVLVKADGLDTAYDKVLQIAETETQPYKGGTDAVDVQWVFEGLTELLPIYEALEDGAEIMWVEHAPRKLKNLRNRTRTRNELTDRQSA